MDLHFYNFACKMLSHYRPKRAITFLHGWREQNSCNYPEFEHVRSYFLRRQAAQGLRGRRA